MKNYLMRYGITRDTDEDQIAEALLRAGQDAIDMQSIKDAEVVLKNKVTRTYYERTHLQYEAISASLSCLQPPMARDTHRWQDRVIEFEPLEDDLLD